MSDHISRAIADTLQSNHGVPNRDEDYGMEVCFLGPGKSGPEHPEHDFHQDVRATGPVRLVLECCRSWERAWAALTATGREVEGWMLMYAVLRGDVPGFLQFAFKDRETRGYLLLPGTLAIPKDQQP